MSVALTDIKKHFGQSSKAVEVLRGLNLQVAEGERVAILGESGSGKSTLLSLLAGLDRPDAGAVVVDGEPLHQYDETSLAHFRARKLGIVFQQFHLMTDLTAIENVALPLELSGQETARGARERASALLHQVGLGERRHHFPRELSGGECQRVAIARALVSRPKLLLADEPTGNLDATTASRVADLLFELVESTKGTMILVTHSEALAKRCHRTLRLAGGVLR